jgi:hypothetical protein
MIRLRSTSTGRWWLVWVNGGRKWVLGPSKVVNAACLTVDPSTLVLEQRREFPSWGVSYRPYMSFMHHMCLSEELGVLVRPSRGLHLHLRVRTALYLGNQNEPFFHIGLYDPPRLIWCMGQPMLQLVYHGDTVPERARLVEALRSVCGSYRYRVGRLDATSTTEAAPKLRPLPKLRPRYGACVRGAGLGSGEGGRRSRGRKRRTPAHAPVGGLSVITIFNTHIKKVRTFSFR